MHTAVGVGILLISQRSECTVLSGLGRGSAKDVAYGANERLMELVMADEYRDEERA
jgi:hypothetical protein